MSFDNANFPIIWGILNEIDEKHDIYDRPNIMFGPTILVLLFQNFDKSIEYLKERLDFLESLAEQQYMGDTKEFAEFIALFHLYHYKISKKQV